MPRSSTKRPSIKRQTASTWSFIVADEHTGLTREKIVDAAVEIADSEGIRSVSMRRIATQLTASPMALYHYVPSKADLLNLMLDRTFTNHNVEKAGRRSWRSVLSVFALEHKRSLEQHKWIMSLPISERQYGPEGIRVLECYLTQLTALGLDVRKSVRILGLILNFVIGFVSNELEINVPGADAGVRFQPFSPQVLASGRYPLVQHLMDVGIEPPSEEAFERSLNWVLNGLSTEMSKKQTAR